MKKLNEIKLSDELIKRYENLYKKIDELSDLHKDNLDAIANWELLYMYTSFINNIPLNDLDPESIEEFQRRCLKIIDRKKLEHIWYWTEKNDNKEEADKIKKILDDYKDLKYFKYDYVPIKLIDLKEGLDFIKKYFNF